MSWRLLLELRLSRRPIWETRRWGMVLGMDADMGGYWRAFPPTMRITIMIAYRMTPTRIRYRGDGMHMLSASD